MFCSDEGKLGLWFCNEELRSCGVPVILNCGFENVP
jgi:hypothetical protein